MPQATPTKSEGNATSFSFPAAHRKKVTAAFDVDRITSDGGVCCWRRPSARWGYPRDRGFLGFQFAGMFERRLVHWGQDHAGGDAVHRDPLRREL
jgi:hypothetical protein